MNIIIDAYLDNNLGDDLMVKLLLHAFPEYSFYLYTGSDVIANSFRDIANLTIKDTSQMKKDLQTADVYLTIGGSRFQLYSLRQKLWRIYRICRLRKIKRKKLKLITIGANLGPFSDKSGKKLSEIELRMNKLVTVRDKEAYQYLKSFRKISNFHLADDIVYNLDSIYKKHNCDRAGLGISAYRSVRHPKNNFANYKALAAISDSYIRKTGKKVKLFAFDSERENDLAAAYHIYDLAQEKANIEIIPYLGDEQVFLPQLETCERFIAIRFHSAVLADVFAIPFLPVVYSNKMKNFLDDREFGGISIPVAELSPSMDTDFLTEQIINGEGLFKDFISKEHTAKVHLVELEKVLSGGLAKYRDNCD